MQPYPGQTEKSHREAVVKETGCSRCGTSDDGCEAGRAQTPATRSTRPGVMETSTHHIQGKTGIIAHS